MAGTTSLAAGTRVAGPVVLGGLTAGALVLVQYREPRLVIGLIALLLGVVLAWVARRHVLAATGIGVALIGVLPVYAGRNLGGTHLGITPALVVAVLLVPAALESLPRFRFVPMDVAVGGYLLLRLLSTLLNFNNKLGSAAGPALYLASSYAVFRLLLLRPGVLAVVTRVVVLLGVAEALFAIGEHAGLGNLFFRFPSSGYEYKDFANEQLRFGEPRAEGSFGHSIALGMFLGLVMVLLVALAVESRHVLARAALLLGGGLVVLGTVDTLSRGALVALALGLLLWFLREARRLKPATLAALAVLGVGVVLLTPVRGTVAELVTSTQSTTDVNVAASTEHRYLILDLARDPSQFSVLGHKSTDSGTGGVNNQLEQRTGIGSFDNAYALVYLANGLLTVLAFLGVAVLAFTTLGSAGLTGVERAWVAGMCAAAVNLFSVNLLTQYQDFYWISAGVAATSWQRVRLARRARKADLARSTA